MKCSRPFERETTPLVAFLSLDQCKLKQTNRAKAPMYRTVTITAGAMKNVENVKSERLKQCVVFTLAS